MSIPEVMDPARLAALRRLGILDTPGEEAFDRLTSLATKIVRAPIALITLVDETRQFFKSCWGLSEPWASWREAPLSYSFCQHVVASHQPLVIEDARTHPEFSQHPATQQLGVVAYLGIPLTLRDGMVLGSFCALDHRPRTWTADEIEIMRVLARAAVTEMELRNEVRRTAEANQQLAHANEGLKAFTFSVAHDLSSHLARLRCFTDVLIEEGVDATADCRGYMLTIQRTVRQITQLFEALLSLAKASTLELHTTVVDMSALAHEIAVELRHSDPQCAMKFVIQNDLTARADPGLARLLLQNLLGNAWKFSARRAGAQVEFSAQPWGGTTKFAVRDNGVGFSSGQADELFQPFHRLPNASGFPGTGLGLQGAKQIVERHGGTIQAEARPGEGACFYFTLAPTLRPTGSEASNADVIGTDLPGALRVAHR